jgi:hypothetical protein
MTGNAFDPLPLPSGVPVPMCWCGDPCKVAKSDEEDTCRQRYWMCDPSSEVNSRQGAECTNGGAKVYTPESAPVRH